MFVVSFSPSRKVPGWYLEYDRTTCFQILYLFSNHPELRRCKIQILEYTLYSSVGRVTMAAAKTKRFNWYETKFPNDLFAKGENAGVM
jgi:hypothetical protein